MRKIALSIIILAAFSLPALAQTPPSGWDIQAAVNAGYVSQTVIALSGKQETKLNPTVMSGIQFWRHSSIFGFSVGAATLADEQQAVSRIAPYAAVHLGTQAAQFFLGAAYDPQDKGNRKTRGVFGFTAAF